MQNSQDLWSNASRLRRACGNVPAWVSTGISGAEGDEGGSGNNGNAGDGGNEPTARERALQEEKDRHYRKAEEAKADAADKAKKLEELEAKLAEIEAKDKSESEKAQAAAAKALKDKEAAEAQVAELKKAQEQSAVQLAFLQNSKYTWHNPGTALKLLDLSEVKIGDDGKVDGLDKAIDALAKNEKYLVKVGPADDGKGNNGQQQTGAAGNGGSTRNANGKPTNEQRQELVAKYNIPR